MHHYAIFAEKSETAMKTEFAIWMVSYLLRRGPDTQENIINEWSKHINEDVEIHRNTFANYRRKAEELFGAEILYNPVTKEYYIEDKDLINHNAMYKWLLQSVSASNVISRRSRLKDRIMLETSSGGEEFIEPITEAMEKGLCLELVYQAFWDEPKERIVEPYYIKLFKRRWYLIGKRRDKGEFRTYCFDRIKSVRISDIKFKFKKEQSAETLFYDYYGIIQYPVEKERVVIKVTCEQGMYIKTLPLHHSQKLIHQDDDYMTFELYLKPCYDFVKELLSCGSELEVISPESLREEVNKYAMEMCEIYNVKENG
ncbi:WYL domain-containing protein [Bacteroides xylanisolvens]|jgi:hypothetical protein|nr:WYL domain-containing protein [Bacteroides xylanisolvens]